MIKCGNCKGHHQTVAEVRFCCQVRAAAPVSPAPVKMLINGRPATPATNPFVPPASPWSFPPGGREATPNQLDFMRILVDQREWSLKNVDGEVYETAMNLLADKWISFAEAGAFITAFKDLPKKGKPVAEFPAPTKEQPWKTLSREVPAGNYKITDEAGKNHFYRVSVGQNDFYKVQERASEELHFVPLARYAGILRSILAAGVEVARLAYAMDQTRCWHCNTKLTDNTQPHYARGLGPICGDHN